MTRVNLAFPAMPKIGEVLDTLIEDLRKHQARLAALLKQASGVALVAASLAATATYAAAQPTLVHLPGGGIVPCDHPLAIQAGLGCGAPGVVTTVPPAPQPPPATTQPGYDYPAPPKPFLVGHTYVRSATTGERVYVASMGALQTERGPLYVFFVQCLSLGGSCQLIPGTSEFHVLTFPINTNRADFVDQGAQP